MDNRTAKVTDASFDEDVRKSEIPVVVSFWAEWCGLSRQVGLALEELAAEYAGRVKIVKLSIDENPQTPADFGVRGIPTHLMFQDGKVVATKVGAVPKAVLAKWIENSL